MEQQKNKPLITVIVPVYNIMDYLERCIASITAQTYENLEIILVDDGSTDGTGELCDKLAEKDPRIAVYHKNNGGSSSARNFGIAHAQGEYLGFVDSDDYIEPDMYELLYQGICRFHANAAQIGRDEMDAQGNRLPDLCVLPREAVIIEPETFLKELLMHRGDCSFCTKLIKREFFTEGFPEGRLNEDFYLFVRMLPKIGGIVSLPHYGYHVFYRIGSNSRKAGKNQFSRVYGDSVENADMVCRIVDTDYPALAGIAFRFAVFQRLEYMLHIPVDQMKRDNTQYRGIVKWLRRNWSKSMRNQILTKKNKCYHTLFATAPCTVRKIHRRIRRIS